MPNSAIFLHLTDTHLALAGTAFPRDDFKIAISGIEQDTREGALDLTLSRLAERLRKDGRRLDGVVFSGDAQDRGRPGGHRILFDLLIKHFGDLGVTAVNILAAGES
jgi:3',5'-cyclic AMP phosphodiesterase CpdA